jgi:hypothetical protein
MTITHRIQRRLGYDTTVEKTAEYTLYEYKITHLNGEVSEEEATHRKWEGSAIMLMMPDEETWARITAHQHEPAMKPFSGWRGFDIVRELEGVQEVEKEEIGTVFFDITIDLADHSLVSVEKRVERKM